MYKRETQYELCQTQLVSIARNSSLLATALRAYRDSDHNVEALDSPFMLEMNEALIGLGVQIESLIQRIAPTYRADGGAQR